MFFRFFCVLVCVAALPAFADSEMRDFLANHPKTVEEYQTQIQCARLFGGPARDDFLLPGVIQAKLPLAVKLFGYQSQHNKGGFASWDWDGTSATPKKFAVSGSLESVLAAAVLTYFQIPPDSKAELSAAAKNALLHLNRYLTHPNGVGVGHQSIPLSIHQTDQGPAEDDDFLYPYQNEPHLEIRRVNWSSQPVLEVGTFGPLTPETKIALKRLNGFLSQRLGDSIRGVSGSWRLSENKPLGVIESIQRIRQRLSGDSASLGDGRLQTLLFEHLGDNPGFLSIGFLVALPSGALVRFGIVADVEAQPDQVNYSSQGAEPVFFGNPVVDDIHKRATSGELAWIADQIFLALQQ